MERVYPPHLVATERADKRIAIDRRRFRVVILVQAELAPQRHAVRLPFDLANTV
jgi:hypothetical protein